MPRYKVRTEDPKSDNFRVTYLTARDKAEAKALQEAREERFANVTFTDAELEQARGRGMKALNDQTEPWKVTAVAKRDQKWGAK